MADVAAHEDEGVGGGACKAGDVADRVLFQISIRRPFRDRRWGTDTRHVENVEAAITEEII